MDIILRRVDESFLKNIKKDGYLLSDQLFAGLIAGQKKKLVKRLNERGYTVQRVGATAAIIQRAA